MEVVGEYIRQIMDDVGRDLVDEIKNQLEKKGKDASGDLISSIHYQLVEKSDSIEVEILSLDYLKYVDQGRKPGKQPPVSKIVPWVQHKGIRMSTKQGNIMTVEQAAFIIARSIGEKGIKPTNIIKNSIDLVYNRRKEDLKAATIEDLQSLTIKILKG